jgi:hypothetical protein
MKRFCAVEDPDVAAALRARLERARVRADARLGQREGADISPSISGGSQRRFCSSVPASMIGSETSFTYAAISDTVPETFASSST